MGEAERTSSRLNAALLGSLLSPLSTVKVSAAALGEAGSQIISLLTIPKKNKTAWIFVKLFLEHEVTLGNELQILPTLLISSQLTQAVDRFENPYLKLRCLQQSDWQRVAVIVTIAP